MRRFGISAVRKPGHDRGHGFGCAQRQVICDERGQSGALGIDFDGRDAELGRPGDRLRDIGKHPRSADGENHVHAFFQGFDEACHLRFGQGFAEQHDVWPQDAAAFRAAWRQVAAIQVFDRFLKAALWTKQRLQVAVDFNEIGASRLAVQSVDVLGEDDGIGDLTFQAGDGQVRRIGLCPAAVVGDLGQVFPRDVRPDGEQRA